MNWSDCEAILKDCGRNIRRTRLGRGWTQDDLAKASGSLGRTSIANIEAGRQKMTILTLAAVSRALGVPPGDILRPAPEVERVAVNVGGKDIYVSPSQLQQILDSSDEQSEVTA